MPDRPAVVGPPEELGVRAQGELALGRDHAGEEELAERQDEQRAQEQEAESGDAVPGVEPPHRGVAGPVAVTSRGR